MAACRAVAKRCRVFITAAISSLASSRVIRASSANTPAYRRTGKKPMFSGGRPSKDCCSRPLPQSRPRRAPFLRALMAVFFALSGKFSFRGLLSSGLVRIGALLAVHGGRRASMRLLDTGQGRASGQFLI